MRQDLTETPLPEEPVQRVHPLLQQSTGTRRGPDGRTTARLRYTQQPTMSRHLLRRCPGYGGPRWSAIFETTSPSFWLIGGTAAMLSTALHAAGGHHAVDDAAIAEPGQCQVE